MATKVKKASETHRHAMYRSEVELRYIEDHQSGQHLVIRTFVADEPNIYRHATIEAARATWKRLRGLLKSEGYERTKHSSDLRR